MFRKHRNHSGYGLSQWETTLQCNGVSHWLIPYPNNPCKYNNNFIPGYLVDYTGDINIPFILFGCLHATGGITILIIPAVRKAQASRQCKRNIPWQLTCDAWYYWVYLFVYVKLTFNNISFTYHFITNTKNMVPTLFQKWNSRTF